MIGIQTRFYWNPSAILAQEEKKQIFRTSNWIGGALLLGQAAMMVAVNAVQIFLLLIGHITSTGEFAYFVDEHFFYIFFGKILSEKWMLILPNAFYAFMERII